MNAIILAAGMGKRLKELTKNNTKCMIRVNGVTLIERMLHQIEKQGVNKITIVVGYMGQALIDYVSTLNISIPIEYINNPIYDKTNNIYSLALAKDVLCEDDTLLFESDLIFEDDVIDALVNDQRPTLALVDKYEAWMDGTCVKIDEDDNIAAFIPGKAIQFSETEEYYKTVNIYKFSKHFSEHCYVPFLDAYKTALGNNEYYEQVLRVITMLDSSEIKAKRLNGQRWYEIDDVQDLDIASSMFHTDPEKKYELLQLRYGGYWRYPRLIDFCYLVNPYFPPIRMCDEIKHSFNKLFTQYPSGMEVNSLLASKNFGVNKNYILIGNGAAELIKELISELEGNTGFIRPTFEEYYNRCSKDRVVFIPETDDFSYNADDIIEYFSVHEINNLVLINPDNPTGNYLCKADVLRLADWCKEKKITLIYDESFIDFAEGENNSLLNDDVLEKYPNIIVVKSISKSYGVPGIRLGVLANSNEQLIEKLKKDVSIWNINSFGEFFMQIFEKYKDDYNNSLKCVKSERKRFTEELKKISNTRVFQSQANYIMLEINNASSKSVASTLLTKYSLLVKDLTPKISDRERQFLRVAVRNTEDNNRLLFALSEIFD